MAINVTPPTGPSAPTPASTDRNIDTQLFTVTGVTVTPVEYSVGDILEREVIYNGTTVETTTWKNITQGTVLTVVPPGVDIVRQEVSCLTDAELRAAPVEVIVTNQVTTDSATGLETVVKSYSTKNDFVGNYVTGDIVQSTEVLDTTVNPPTIQSIVWKNVTQNIDNISVDTNDLVLLPSSALTDAELRASPIETFPYDVEAELYTANATGTGYSEGDILRRVATYKTADGTATVVWENVSLGTTLAGSPLNSHLSIASGSGAGYDTETQFYVAKIANPTIGYSVDDELLRVVTYDNNVIPAAIVTETWRNISTGAYLSGIATPGEYKVYSGANTAVENEANLIRTTTQGVVAGGAYEISISNIGDADILVQGTALPPGYSVEFTADAGDYLEQVIYDATGSEALIQSTYATAPIPVTPEVFTPYITNVTNGQLEVSVTGPFEASPYNATGSAGIHASSEWEIYSDAALTTLVAAINDPSMLTSATVASPGLALNTPYYIRVRYTSATAVVSNWSPVIQFTTDSSLPLIVTSQSSTGSGPYDVYIDIDNTNSPATIDWGDGVIEDWAKGTQAQHTYADAGPHDILIKGHRALRFADTLADTIVDVKQWGNASYTSLRNMFNFNGSGTLNVSATDTPNFSQVTDTLYMFVGANITGSIATMDPGLSGLTTLTYMFSNLGGPIPSDISSWDVSAVTSLRGTFDNSNSTDMSEVDITGWNVSNVTNMEWTFSQTKFNQDITGWNVSSVTHMLGMFFSNADFNQPISSWNISNVENMDHMFNTATGFTQSLYGWNPASCTSASNMFYSCPNYYESLKWVYFPLIKSDVYGDDPLTYLGLGNAIYYNNYDIRNQVPMGVGSNGGTVVTVLAPRSYNTVSVYNVTSDGTGFIDWGDGVIQNIPAGTQTVSHTYTSRSIDVYYTIELYGGISSLAFTGSNSDVTRISTFHRFGNLAFDSLEDFLFHAGTYLVEKDQKRVFNSEDSPIFNPGASIARAFTQWFKFDLSCDLSNWDVSNVTDMEETFDGFGTFSGGLSSGVLNLSNWDVSNVTEAKAMLALDYSDGGEVITTGLNFASLVGNAYKLFGIRALGSATAVQSVANLINTTTFPVMQDAYGVFNGLTLDQDTSVDITMDCFTNSPLTKLRYTYQYLSFAGTLDVSAMDTSSVDDMTNCFMGVNGEGITNTLDLTTFDTSSVIYLNGTFDYTFNYNDAKVFVIDITGWNTSNVTDMPATFASLDSYVSILGVENLDTSSVQNFESTFSRTTIPFDFTSWNTSSATTMKAMFTSYSGLATVDLTSWDTSNVETMDNMFSNTVFNPDITTWNTSSATNMFGMFYGNTGFDQDIGGWNTTNVTNMSNMFYNATAFSYDISRWCVSNVTAYYQAFFGASSYNHDSPKWGWCWPTLYPTPKANTIAIVVGRPDGDKTPEAFGYQVAAEGSGMTFYIDGKEVRTLTTTSTLAGSMGPGSDYLLEFSFSNVFANNEIEIILRDGAIIKDVLQWSTQKLKDIRILGTSLGAFEDNTYITGFSATDRPNFSTNASLDRWFYGATNFNQDLSHWCVPNIASEPFNFSTGATNWTLPKPVWGTCP